MDLLILDKDTYLPKKLFERYTSLIWTERFNTCGEFQLTSPRIEETLATFPLGTLVSLRDTTEVMIVETFDIKPNSSDGYPEITIFGRSLDSFLENRVLLPIFYGQDWTTLRAYTPYHMVALLIWNTLVNTTGKDPTKAVEHQLTYFSDDTRLIIPKLVVSLGSSLN